MSNAIKDLGVGTAIGYGASMAMGRATDWYLGHQSKESRLREEEVAPGGAPVLVGKKLAGLVGRGVSDENAANIGTIVHRALGMTYGVAASVVTSNSSSGSSSSVAMAMASMPSRTAPAAQPP